MDADEISEFAEALADACEPYRDKLVAGECCPLGCLYPGPHGPDEPHGWRVCDRSMGDVPTKDAMSFCIGFDDRDHDLASDDDLVRLGTRFRECVRTGEAF